MVGFLWGIGIAAVMLLGIGFVVGPVRQRSRQLRFLRAQRSFHTEREWLEAKFVQLATAAPGLDVPRWADCAFADDVAYARSRSTGELSALVAVTLAADAFGLTTQSTADVIGNLQAGTAVFRFDGTHWVTDGRAILNLSPSETIHRFRDDLERVGDRAARRPA
jgi:hypothetical protein